MTGTYKRPRKKTTKRRKAAPKHAVPWEDSEQQMLVRRLKGLEHQWNRDPLRLVPFKWYHVPNGSEDGEERSHQSALGVQPGVMDLWIVTPPPARPWCPGACLELKRLKGGRLSPEQRQWITDMRALGWAVPDGDGSLVGWVRAWVWIQELGYRG